MTSLTITQGNASSPSDPFGQETLVLGTDGSLRYIRTRLDTLRRQGRVDPTVVTELVAQLRAAGFPKAPPQQIPPGASLVKIEVSEDGRTQQAWVHFHSARRVEGWGPALLLAQTWCTWLRSDGLRPPPQGLSID